MNKFLELCDGLLAKVLPLDEVHAGCAPYEVQQNCYCYTGVYPHFWMTRTRYTNPDCTYSYGPCSGDPSNRC